MRVVDAVAHHKKRRFPRLARGAQDVRQLRVFVRGGNRNHALVRARRAHRIQALAVALIDTDTQRGGLAFSAVSALSFEPYSM